MEWWCVVVAGGVFTGADTSCADVVDCAYGACCRPEGFCEISVEYDCVTTHGGTWGGAGSVCDDLDNNGIADDCESSHGACGRPEGFC